MDNQEKRFLSSDFEVRDKGGKTVVEGYAARFEDETVIGGKFAERVARGAFDKADMSNTVALFNHDWNQPLSRAGKGLKLEVDEVGLKYRFELGDQSYAKDLAENIRSGNVSTSSFGFTVADDSWERRDNGVHLRTIMEVETLFDVSPTTQGAYPTTEVGLRSMEAALDREVEEELRKLEEEEEEMKMEDEEEEKPEERPGHYEEEEEEEENMKEEEEEEVEEKMEEETEEPPAEKKEAEEEDNKNEERSAQNKSKSNMEDNKNAAPAVVQGLGDAEARAAKNFSFGKFLKEAAKGQVTGLEAEMTQEGTNEMRNAGLNVSGGYNIPTMVLRSLGTASTESSSGAADGATGFGGAIGKRDDGIMENYAPADLASKLGVRNLTNLNGDVLMQVQSTLTAAEAVAEGLTKAEALPAFGSVTLSPTRYAANVGVTQQMLAQSGDDMAAFIQMDIRRALDKQFNAAIITAIEAVDTPLDATDDANNVLDIEQAILAGDIDLNDVVFVASPSGYRVARTESLDVGSGLLHATDPKSRISLLGMPGVISSQATANDINFFDKNQMVTGTWGGLNLIVDPYTLAADGVVRMVANEYRDVKTLQSGGFKTLANLGETS